MVRPFNSASAEEARIGAAYAKRELGDPRYSWFSPSYQFMVHQRERRLLALLRRYDYENLESKQILEVGCGTGQWLRDFIKWGARPENVTGVELLSDRVAEAVHLCPKEMHIQRGNAAKLEFADAAFDLVLQSAVFTSVLDTTVKQQIASEMLRVVKSDGLIVWYDYHVNNPWNPDVRGVKKGEIHTLFPGCQIKLQRVTLAPPLARWIARRAWLLAFLLERIPLLCTHYIGIIRK